jgi:hypothetical protein
MADESYELRPTEAADAGALNELYERLTGRRRSVEQWRWEWLEVPGGPAPSWVIVERASGKIVGHHGLVPVPLARGGRALRGARTENTMVAPEHRERFYYPAFEAQLLREVAPRFDVLYTCAGKSVQAAMRRRLGYRTAGSWETWTAAQGPAHRAARNAGRAAALALRPLAALARKAPAGWEIDEAPALERVESLWRLSAADFALAPLREADFLRWRLLENPYHRISLAIAREAGADRGFLAWREERAGRAGLRVVVEDLFVRGNDEVGCRAALRLLAWRYRASPARVLVRTTAADRPLRRAAAGLAPRSRQVPLTDGAELLVRSEVLAPGEPWDATALIDEGL